MAPSSLKKMREFQEMKEGNYASLENIPLGRVTNRDLGLTLLPGSQIQRKDEKISGTAAESSPKKPGSRDVVRPEKCKLFETETQQEHSAQQTACPYEAKSPNSSPNTGPEPAKLSHVTAGRNRERVFFQSGSAKDGSDMPQHNVKSVTTTPYAKLIIDTDEMENANSCQHDDSSPRAMKRRKLGRNTPGEMRYLIGSKGKELAVEIHYNRSHMHHGQKLYKTSAVYSENRKSSVATNGAPFSGTAGGSGTSKPDSHHQITHSPDAAPARPYQSIIKEFNNVALHGSSSALAAATSRSSPKRQHSELVQPPISSRSVFTRFLSDTRVFPDNPAEIRTRVLKPRKEVNRSWTSHFPAKAKIHRCTKLPAPSLLVAPFAQNNAATTFHAHRIFSSTRPSSLMTDYPSLSKAFNYSLDGCILKNNFDTAHDSNQGQSTRRRSASMPNIWSTCVPINMDSSNRFGPASMPTPPHEQPSSPAYLPCSNPLTHNDNALFRQNVVDPRGHVDMSFNTENSSSQNWQFNSNFQRQHENGLSNPQIIPSLQGRQFMTQPSSNQGLTETMVAGGPQYVRRPLKVKSSYSHEEVKALMFTAVGQAKALEAENTRLLSLNAAMKKGFESLRHEKADMVKEIQRYERADAQKDKQMDAMRRKGSSLQRQCRQLWDEYSKLLATTRRENGTGNLSAIAEKIRWNHSPNAVASANQGRQTSADGANATPVYYANHAQLPTPRHGFEQMPTGFHGHVQPASVPAHSETNVNNASSQSLHQQEYAAANHYDADPSQTAPIPAYSEADVARPSSQALSQPGFASINHGNVKTPQPVSILACPEANVANALRQASVQPGIAAINHESANSPHDGSTGLVFSNQPLDGALRTATINGQNNERPIEQVPVELMTIDLTDNSQSSLSSTSRDTSVHQTHGSSVPGAHQRLSFQPSRYPPAHYPAGHFVSSQYPSGLPAQNQVSQSQPPLDQDPQGRNLEAMQIQKEAFARMAEKPLTWLQGRNPFKIGTETNPYKKGTKTGERVELPSSRLPSQSNVEEDVPFAQSPEAGRVAPLPETATGRNTKKKVTKKTKVVLDAEAKKERAKIYRKTAAEKKKREKQIAKQLLQEESMSNNAMRAQKQDRRAIKGEKRKEQARKPAEEVGSQERQKTLDGRLHQGNTGVQQAMREGSAEEAAPDDYESLFGDDEDNDMEAEEFQASPDADSAMHDDDDDAVEEDVDPFAAQLEALLEADTDAKASAGAGAGAGAGTTTGAEQDNALGGETFAGGDHGYHDFSSESEKREESEESEAE